MRRAVLSVVLLLAAAPAFSAPSSEALTLRARRLLGEIRAQEAAAKKDFAHLRSELSALQAENKTSPDVKVAAQLRLAEANLALEEAGSPLPPPTIEETLSDQDLPDRDAVAQPAPPQRAIVSHAGSAVLPESAGRVFDGSRGRGGLSEGLVQVPPEDPNANLDRYLGLDKDDDEGRYDLLYSASGRLLEKLKEKDDDGKRSQFLTLMLAQAIQSHPQRAHFSNLRVRVPKDKFLHLVYRGTEGVDVDEVLGTWDEWSKPRSGRKLPGPKRPRKKGSVGKKGGDDEDGGGGGGSSHRGGKKGGGRKGHGAGGGGGGGGDADGGDGGGGGGGGGSHHAKVPHTKGGGAMFDGSSEGGDGAVAGPGGAHHGRGGGDRAARKGKGSSAAGGGGSSVASGGSHARAGKYISGDSDGGDSSSGPHKKRGTSVPLPKDFTSRGHGSRLHGDGGGEGGGGRDGGGEGGGDGGGGPGMSSRGRKGHREVPPPPATGAPGALAHGKPAVNQAANTAVAAVSSARAAAPSGPALNAPLAADEDLHDAVAGHATPSRPALPPLALAPTPAAPASAPPADSWPLAAACAVAGGIGLGAYAFRRSRRA